MTFAPLKNESVQEYHLGLVFLYNIVRNRRSSFFVYQSNYFRYKEETITTSYWDPNNQRTVFEEQAQISERWNHGVGIGIEFLIVRVVSFNLMGGFGAYDDFKTIGVAGEAGLYYRF